MGSRGKKRKGGTARREAVRLGLAGKGKAGDRIGLAGKGKADDRLGLAGKGKADKGREEGILARMGRMAGKVALGCAGAGVLLAGGFVAYLTVTEYRPKDVEELEILHEGKRRPRRGEEISVATYNMGYGCNGEEADFFMDGGTMVRAKRKEDVRKNVSGSIGVLDSLDADVLFLQEVDMDSKRAYGIDEVREIADYFEGEASACFAPNYWVRYVPYPVLEPIGRVKAGLVTVSRFLASGASRHSLPCSYKWPIRLGQLKRGLLVERVPVADSDREVVFVNLHLEAYAGAEKKAAQTEKLARLVQSEYEKGNYVIAGGDFNQSFPHVDTESRYPIRDAEHFVPEKMDGSMLPDGWEWATDLSVPSSRLLNEPYDPKSERTQYYVIDGFLVSPNVEVVEVRTADMAFSYSDHNPVVLKARLR